MEKIKRIMLKLSGEALAKDEGGFNEAEIRRIAGQVKTLCDQGIEVAIVIGGGNFWRGRTGVEIDRPKSDSIGMLATVMNCIYVSEFFRYEGMKTCIMTPFICSTFTELFSKDRANECFEQGKVLFFAGGTGHPYFSTDMSMVLRAIEINADMILAAKNIDGVYDSDPATNPNAKKYDRLTIEEIVDKKLKVIDLTASMMLLENKIPMRLFALNAENSIVNALGDHFSGTEVIV